VSPGKASARYTTSSSAIAERLRDASCLSVVSFNIPTAQFFLLLATAASDLLVHKINFENICIRFGTIHERDGRTDKHRMTIYHIGRAYASHAAAKTRMVGLPDGEKTLRICVTI